MQLNQVIVKRNISLLGYVFYFIFVAYLCVSGEVMSSA